MMIIELMVIAVLW